MKYILEESSPFPFPSNARVLSEQSLAPTAAALPAEFFNEGTCEYGRRALLSLIVGTEGIIPGDQKRGRHRWALYACVTVLDLIEAGCLDERALTVIADEWKSLKPDARRDELTGILAYAKAQATPRTGCGVHSAS